MTSPVNVTQQWKAVQYNGSNASVVDSMVSSYTDFTINSEIGGVLNWSGTQNTYNTDTGDWFIVRSGEVFFIPNSLYVKEWQCMAVCTEIADLDTRVDTLESDLGALTTAVTGAFVRSVGVAPVPTLLLSGTATVAVQLQPAMPDSGYTAYASKFAGVSLTDLQINSVTVVDADTVNVAVENVGVATIVGATVMVHAID